MLDFDELMGRGILAARKGNSAEAAEERMCLEHVLELAPDTLVAQALLKRLDQKRLTAYAERAELVIFTCPSCGGRQRFDPDQLGLLCEYCQYLDPLVVTDASNAEVVLNTEPSSGSGTWAVLDTQAACRACGARLYQPADQGTLTCPFCGSNEVTIVPATPNLIHPTAIGTFLIHQDAVHRLLDNWWRRSFVLPVDKLDPHTLTISPIYLPFWTFDGRARVSISGINIAIEPQVYSEHDRVVPKEQGSVLKGPYYEYDFDDLLVYAAHSLPEERIRQLYPFLLKSLLEYSPAVLAGWPAEIYQIALEDAAAVAYKKMRDLAFRAAAQHRIFIDPNKMLSDDVDVLNRTYKLILLPVWVVRYAFRQRFYQALVNGQTGQVGGEHPPDKFALFLKWLAGAVLIVAVIALFFGRFLYTQWHIWYLMHFCHYC